MYYVSPFHGMLEIKKNRYIGQVGAVSVRKGWRAGLQVGKHWFWLGEMSILEN